MRKNQVEKVCEVCRKRFSIKKSHDFAKYCSVKCYQTARYLKSTTAKNCEFCGKEFRIRNSFVKHREKNNKVVGKFCSKLCTSRTQIGKKLSEEHRKKLSIAHKGVKLSPAHIEARSRGQRGENHPNWKGGVAQHKAIYQARRIARKNNNGGSHTLGEWERLKAQYNWTCPGCHLEEPQVKLTKDHIIPIAKGGSDNIENIQPLCGRCNVKKATKAIRYELVEVTKNQ